MNWRDIPGCAGYQVSDTGQVRNRLCNLEWATPGENIRHAFQQLGRKSGNERAVIAEKAGSRLIFASVLDAARAGFNRRGIHQCLNGSYSQHKGFQWRYA